MLLNDFVLMTDGLGHASMLLSRVVVGEYLARGLCPLQSRSEQRKHVDPQHEHIHKTKVVVAVVTSFTAIIGFIFDTGIIATFTAITVTETIVTSIIPLVIAAREVNSSQKNCFLYCPPRRNTCSHPPHTRAFTITNHHQLASSSSSSVAMLAQDHCPSTICLRCCLLFPNQSLLCRGPSGFKA